MGMATLADDEIRSGARRPTRLGARRRRRSRREYRLDGFAGAIAFVVRLSYEAEAADHHPDLDIRYNRVRVTLSTHSEGGVTAKDLDLARAIEGSRRPQ